MARILGAGPGSDGAGLSSCQWFRSAVGQTRASTTKFTQHQTCIGKVYVAVFRPIVWCVLGCNIGWPGQWGGGMCWYVINCVGRHCLISPRSERQAHVFGFSFWSWQCARGGPARQHCNWQCEWAGVDNSSLDNPSQTWLVMGPKFSKAKSLPLSLAVANAPDSLSHHV